MCHNLQVWPERDPELLSKITIGEMMGDYWYDPDTKRHLSGKPTYFQAQTKGCLVQSNSVHVKMTNTTLQTKHPSKNLFNTLVTILQGIKNTEVKPAKQMNMNKNNQKI